MKALILSVAVAANMMPVMQALKPGFEKRTGIQLALTPGASGKFAAQIESGAPFDLFVSADQSFPEALAGKGLASGKPAVYAYGTLILWSLSGADVNGGVEGLKSPAVKKIAVADPKTAPYGRAAVEALKKAGVYEAVESKLVYGESISQVNQFITSKAADVGFAARSIVETDDWKGKGAWAPVDPKLYAPIGQSLLVLKAAKNQAGAKKLRSYILGAKGRAVLKRFGYSLP